jgi:hypothetical protein
VLALWIQGSPRNRRILVVLALVGALVNLPAIIVPTTAQMVQRPPPRGPNVARQFELMPPTIRDAARDLSSFTANRTYFYLWQANMSRELGRSGAVLAALLSMLLAAVAVVSGALLRRVLYTDPDGDLSRTPSLDRFAEHRAAQARSA